MGRRYFALNSNREPGMSLDPHLFEPAEIPSDRLALYDSFVAQYLIDFDPYAACLRVGFMQTFASQQALELMGTGYVQRKIAYLTRLPNDPDQEAKDRALVESALREAMQRGPYASRVAAAKAFGDLKGWNKPDRQDDAGNELVEALRSFGEVAPV